jgi:hypothetical protein
MTVGRREQHGRPPRYRDRRPAFSRKLRHRLCRPHNRRPAGNLAVAQQALQAWLRQHATTPSAAALNAAPNALEAQVQFMVRSARSRPVSPNTTASSTSIWRTSSGGASKSVPTDGESRRTSDQVLPQRRDAATPASSPGRINRTGLSPQVSAGYVFTARSTAKTT